MGSGAEVICKYHAILYKELEQGILEPIPREYHGTKYIHMNTDV
jgi:hypothetical protein